jgi:hypothetical protein
MSVVPQPWQQFGWRTAVPEERLLTAETVLAAVDRRDRDEIRKLFRGRSEKERRAIAPAIIAAYEALPPSGSGRWPWGLWAAMYGSANLAEMKEFGVHPCWTDAVYLMLLDRSPAWLPAWFDLALGWLGRGESFGFCRRLIREGVVDRPESDEYIRLMFFNWHYSFHPRDTPDTTEHGWRVYASVHDAMIDQPELLEYEVWRLFEVGPRANAHFGGSLSKWWTEGLVTLAAEGRIDRTRLLAACLQALNRDFSAYQCRWYKQIHDDLLPTLEEASACQSQYMRLLSARQPTVVKFAVKNLSVLAAGGELPAEPFIAEVDAVLYAMPKVTALAALRLLGKVVREHPVHTRTALQAATAGLSHHHPDVQKAALDLIERHRRVVDQELRVTLASYHDVIDGSLLQRLVALT